MVALYNSKGAEKNRRSQLEAGGTQLGAPMESSRKELVSFVAGLECFRQGRDRPNRLDVGPVSLGHHKRGKSQSSAAEESGVVKFRWKRLEGPEDERI